jgi:hypothetical protein
MENHSSTRFSSFEILRIIVPGLYFIFVVYILGSAFELQLHPFDLWQIGFPTFFVGTILAGLSFYAKETPKRRKAFQSNQPSLYILERSRELSTRPLTEDEARRLYFYILNLHIPITIHDKIFFFGMIYHIMNNIRRTSFWFGIAGIGALIVQFTTKAYFTQSAFTTVVLIWIVYILNVHYNKADRKMQENYQDQIFWLEMNRDIVDSLILQRLNLSKE